MKSLEKKRNKAVFILFAVILALICAVIAVIIFFNSRPEPDALVGKSTQNQDLSEDFVDKAKQFLEYFKPRVVEVNNLLTFNKIKQ